MRLIAVVLCLLLGNVIEIKAQDSIPPKKLICPAGYTEKLDVTAFTVNGWEGKMDIYLPPKELGLAPLVINIHGGGWNKGTRQAAVGGLYGFLKKNYAIANISYRLTGTATAPAAIEDVRAALFYLLRNLKELNIDPDKVVLMGGSAGGHLALMCGLLGNNHIFDDVAGNNRPKVKIAAIIDKYGISDVWDWANGPNKTSISARKWLGDKADDREFANSVSPVNYVSKDSPPVFIVHGDADPIVPISHSETLYQKLLAAGVKTEFQIVKGGLHGKFSPEDDKEIGRRIMQFLNSLKIHQ